MNKPMFRYVGTKIVNAAPLTRGEYNALRGWETPADENPADAGYLVEYVDGGKPNHPEFEGYISWSPADVFAKAYRPNPGMTFGQAIEALKAGGRVARAGDDIQGTIELPGDGVFTLECMSLIVRDLAKKTNVPPHQVVQDLYSLVAIQATEAGG